MIGAAKIRCALRVISNWTGEPIGYFKKRRVYVIVVLSGKEHSGRLLK
jgi:hypothetical protein